MPALRDTHPPRRLHEPLVVHLSALPAAAAPSPVLTQRAVPDRRSASTACGTTPCTSTGVQASVRTHAETHAELDDPWQALTGFMAAALELQAADRGLNELLLSSVNPHAVQAKTWRSGSSVESEMSKPGVRHASPVGAHTQTDWHGQDWTVRAATGGVSIGSIVSRSVGRERAGKINLPAG